MTPSAHQVIRAVTVTAVLATAMIAGLGDGTAGASGDDVAVNGSYTAVSDGQWAKTNESFHDETTVTSTWTITSSCTTYQDCTGRVTSDQGWSAALRYQSLVWSVVRNVPDWQHCPDGTTAPGKQTFTFWPRRADADKSTLIGRDQTVGPSGACGVNKWLTITMPLTLTEIS
jgi:hypothetical protein